jgi:hypothetical protein
MFFSVVLTKFAVFLGKIRQIKNLGKKNPWSGQISSFFVIVGTNPLALLFQDLAAQEK